MAVRTRCWASVLTVLGVTYAAAAPLRVCTTTPDLASLVQTAGGEQVEVTSFAKGTEDPHFVEARPSFVKALSQADLLVITGLDLEVGYLPPLLESARNPAVLPGGRGYLDASRAVTPLEVPVGTVDRSMGDIHPYGNPHYLLDPLNGLAVARLIAEKLGELRPAVRDVFARRVESFRRDVASRLMGAELAARYDVEKLLALAELGGLDRFLASRGESDLLGGWLGRLRPYHGTPFVDDHQLWPYFARRFGLEGVAHMEPRPGIPPTTRHLAEVVELMRVRDVRLILASAYYDPRHARFLAEQTGARVAVLAHQVGARPGVDDYLDMVDHNVNAIAAALGGAA